MVAELAYSEWSPYLCGLLVTGAASAIAAPFGFVSFVRFDFDHTGLNQLFSHLGNFPNQLFETIQNLWPRHELTTVGVGNCAPRIGN